MSKKIIGLGILLATSNAFAQSAPASSVELYGIIDLAIGHVEHSLSADPNYGNTVNGYTATKSTINNPLNAMINGGIQGSRWGLRGSEDLGGGLRSFFVLESGFNAQDGVLPNGAASLALNSPKASTVSSNSSLNGQLFNRQAYVGVSDASLGTLAVGRNYNPIYEIVTDYDPVAQSQTFSALGSSNAVGGGGGFSENVRIDNSVRYKNKVGALSFGALYKIGGAAGNNSAGSAYALNLGYEEGPFGIQAAYEEFTDALKSSVSTVAGNVNVTNYNTSAYFIAGKYIFGQATLRGGYESYKLRAPSDSLASLGITTFAGYPIGNAASASANFGAAEQTTDVWFFGGDYNFTPALNLAIGFYDQNPKRSSDAKQLDGNIYTYSALLDYHFTRRTDVYAGVMYSQYKGADYSAPFVAGGDNTSNYVTGFGLRTKF
ncbi:MAG TPA: porin [Burkholderiaceae bacterium]